MFTEQYFQIDNQAEYHTYRHMHMDTHTDIQTDSDTCDTLSSRVNTNQHINPPDSYSKLVIGL